MRFARVPYTSTTGSISDISVVILQPTAKNVTGSILFLIVVAALALPMSVRAQENAVPAQAPAGVPDQIPGQGPTQPPPQANPPPTQPQDAEKRRFVFHRIDGGVLRLDMVTGAVDSCTQNDVGLTCIPARDERAALDREVAQLRRDNAVLKNLLLEHGVPLPEGMAPGRSGVGNRWGGDEPIPRPPQTVPPPAAPPGGTQGAPPESTVDRIADAVERSWRRLVETITNLVRDLEK